MTHGEGEKIGDESPGTYDKNINKNKVSSGFLQVTPTTLDDRYTINLNRVCLHNATENRRRRTTPS